GRWYIPRRDPRWLRRNALVALGNVGDGADPAVRATLDRYAEGDDDLLAEPPKRKSSGGGPPAPPTGIDEPRSRRRKRRSRPS
ncbi:MAG: epoxyqueuosine reductase, partial [Actinomycetota bacterium]|nr:epoxyqueuosine reductase [Actinomycetota bacterium]